MTGVPPELAGLGEAEEFFEALEVPFDPAVLAGQRLQILARFGRALDALDAAALAEPARRRTVLREALRQAYAAAAGGAAALPAGPVVRLGRPRPVRAA